jgi:hypothetical protein
MDAAEKLSIRAEAAAEANLAIALQVVYAVGPARFDDDMVGALRETYKLGWITGFRASLSDLATQLKGLMDDE